MEKIIHQMWFQGHSALPDNYNENLQSWQRLNPEYDYQFWDETRIRLFLDDHYPEFVSRWDSLDKMIKKCDAARYFILHYYGGIYADVDTKAHRPIDELIDRLDLDYSDVIFSKECHEPRCWKNNVRKRLADAQSSDEVVGNAVLLSRSNQQFWTEFLARAFERQSESVLESFSTWHLTRFISEYHGDSLVTVIPEKYLLSMTFDENSSFVTHTYDATWFNYENQRPWEG